LAYLKQFISTPSIVVILFFFCRREGKNSYGSFHLPLLTNARCLAYRPFKEKEEKKLRCYGIERIVRKYRPPVVLKRTGELAGKFIASIINSTPGR